MAATISTDNTSCARSLLVVAWVDQGIGETGMHQYIKDKFEKLSSFITQWLYFDSSDDFVSYAETTKNVKLISVMSGGMSRLLVPKYSHLDHLYSFYVFCADIDRAQQAMEGETKVKGIFNIEDDLYEQMADDLSKLLLEEGIMLAESDERTGAKQKYEEAKRLLSTQANKVGIAEKNDRLEEIDIRIAQLLA